MSPERVDNHRGTYVGIRLLSFTLDEIVLQKEMLK